MASKHMNYIQKARSILAEKIDVEEDLLDVYTLLVFTTGSDTEIVDVHEAWAIWKNKTDPYTRGAGVRQKIRRGDTGNGA
jgi:hypothetical protein